jgi:hypothetical protein
VAIAPHDAGVWVKPWTRNVDELVIA